MPDNLDQINVTTRRYINTTPALVDNVFNQDPLNYFMRQTLKESFGGGSSINQDFLFNTQPGGGYLKGKNFNIAQRQTEQQGRFDIKFTQVSVTLYQEDIQVINKGDLAAIKLLKTRVDQGYMSLGAFVSIAQYLPGVDPGYTPNLNGIVEALNDGTTQGWNGNTYPTYGGLTRSAFNQSLMSTPLNLNGGSIEYDTMDQVYMSAFYGSGTYEPNLLVTTPIGYSYIKSKFQIQQRFQETKLDVGVGFRGMTFNGATIVASRYCPGSYITGQTPAGQDVVATTYLSETSNGSITTYPVGNLSPGGKPAETLFILNARKDFMTYYVSSDATYGGGFRDFIPSANNTILAGQVLLGHAFTMQPRYHRYIYGFAS